MTKRVVIVGAGYAGVEAALALNKMKKKDSVDITLIDKNNYHTLLTEIHEVAGNRVSEEAVRIPLDRIFKFTDVNVVCDKIDKFDFENNKVASDKNEYHYDYLILAIGSKPNFYGIPGLEEHAFTLWSFEDAVKIREHIKKCFLLAAQEKDEQERKKLLTFVVGGAGFTGVEMIGELAHWSRDLARKHNIDRKEIRLIILDVLPRILNTLDEKIAEKTHRYLEKKLGVEVMLNTGVEEVTSEGFSTGDNFIKTKTLIWAAGIRASSDVDNMDIDTVNHSKRLKVDEFCRTKYENVYAVGDISGLVDEKGSLYPAMVENAIQTASGAAKNIMNSIRGKKLEKVEVKMHGIMVSVGNYFAVSDIMGKKLPVWLSIIMKFLVNMHYLWEITGFQGVGRYLYHEVLERRQRKLFLEKHWSTRMQVWWLVPLRIFFGVMWLYEGIKKVVEGWLTSPMLASFLGFASDGTTGATPSAAFVRRLDDIFRLDLKIFNFIIGKESRLVEGSAISSEIFTKLEILHIGNFNPIPWFLKNVVLATDGIAMFFQVLVVILEILVGLMLIGGALTFIASVISFGLMMMFITSTGLYEKSWWMIFASIATMGGAGRGFGLDYILIPYLNNVWERFRKNGKLRLFFRGSCDRHDS
ncbi:MAG TPA: NAD(P)/FAD-dependent oxidoreductase [Clostridiaceae bacterium]|nr:NAD(P)/FAD-dependent oxidoreductase [Clostridiaceae bacterium]